MGVAGLVANLLGVHSGNHKFASGWESINRKMKTFENQTFESFYDRNSGKTFSDLIFRKCRFGSCAISITRDVNLRSTVRNVAMTNCQLVSGSIRSAILEDVIIENLKLTHLLICRAAVFKHVVLKGKIGQVMITPDVDPLNATPDEQEAFDTANAAYYETVDWALDISEAEFAELDLRCVPARLIRRDPETQAVVTRERALRGDWRKLGFDKACWNVGLWMFLESGRADTVLVAAKRSKNFRDQLEGLKLLRKAGIAEPD